MGFKFIPTIIISAIIAWGAGKLMKFDEPWWKDILLGLAGGALGGWIASLMGVDSSGYVFRSIIFGIIGTCIIVFLYRLIKTKILKK